VKERVAAWVSPASLRLRRPSWVYRSSWEASEVKLDSQSCQLNHLLLRIPTTPRHFVFLTLEGPDYHSSFIDDLGLKRGSVTVTERSVSVVFSKEVHMLKPVGYMGLDVNERNVTVSITNGYEHRFNEFGEVVEIKERYKEIRAKLAKKTQGRQEDRQGAPL
jgi:hypothetical protein